MYLYLSYLLTFTYNTFRFRPTAGICRTPHRTAPHRTAPQYVNVHNVPYRTMERNLNTIRCTDTSRLAVLLYHTAVLWYPYCWLVANALANFTRLRLGLRCDAMRCDAMRCDVMWYTYICTSIFIHTSHTYVYDAGTL